jgi:hypothetical protein
MVRCIPDQPRMVNNAEQMVWDRLRAQCGAGDLLIAGQRVTNHTKDFEIDVVAVLEGAGVVTLEVKGGQVTHDGKSWQQRHGPIDPVSQVRDAKYALRNYVETDPRWGGRRRLRWAHLVVLPHTELPGDFALPECPRWTVIDRTQLDEIAELARIALRQQDSVNRVPNAEDVDLLEQVLAGRGLPQRDVVARALEHEEAADRLTEQQSVILGAIQLLHRVEIRGGAGSGKTHLACEQARRLSQSGQRVALLCYSHGLASYLRRLCALWPRRQRPGYVGEFHALGLGWGAPAAPVATAEHPQFFEHDLPAVMTELAQQLPPGQRFDAIVVDEAQDFDDSWWPPLLGALKDPDRSGLYVFSDEGQRVFDRQGTPPVPLVPLVLDANLRSEDVALLSTGSRHPEQVERQALGPKAYWDTFWDAEQVFYGHVLGFKGLERRAVVLAVNSLPDEMRLRERIYVGLSRARDELVVCGDPAVVREVGGPELARRLGV